MKAIAYEQTGAIDHLKLIDIPPPQHQAGHVRLKFRAGSLNHLDLWVLKGLPRVTYSFPHIVGADFCGEVLDPRSSRFKKGDRVIVYPGEAGSAPENLQPDFKIRGENTAGVFAEEISVAENYVFLAPQHLTDNEAAALPLVYLTAWQMVIDRAGLANDSDPGPILVHGAGSGVTQAILELLITKKCRSVAVTSRSAEKLAPWKARGIQTFVTGPDLESQIKTWAGSQRVAIIFDHIGEALFETNIRLLRNGGRFITCGATSGMQGKINLAHLYFRQLQLLGSTMGSLAHFTAMLDWVSLHKIRPKVSKTFPFAKIREAFTLMETAAQDGKIVIQG